MVKIGDIFEIPISNNQKGYAQYIIKDKMGPIIQVFACIALTRPKVDHVLNSGPLFPPIITGLSAAVKSGLWTKIENVQLKNIKYPGFVSTLYDQKTGEANIWFYWDGNKSIRLGTELQDEFKNKEYLMVWDPHDVVHRIETGEYPFPYKELILFNKFTPRNE
jgi:hypothetical protein